MTIDQIEPTQKVDQILESQSQEQKDAKLYGLLVQQGLDDKEIGSVMANMGESPADEPINEASVMFESQFVMFEHSQEGSDRYSQGRRSGIKKIDEERQLEIIKRGEQEAKKQKDTEIRRQRTDFIVKQRSLLEEQGEIDKEKL